MDMDSELLTTEEVAKALRVSEEAVRFWLREGKLRGLRVGRRWRIRKDDLDEYLQRNTPSHS